LGGLAQRRLELGEGLLDRVEVGAVGWQVDELGACAAIASAMPAILSLLRLSSGAKSFGRSVGGSI
jgi:hypothetical protein